MAGLVVVVIKRSRRFIKSFLAVRVVLRLRRRPCPPATVRPLRVRLEGAKAVVVHDVRAITVGDRVPLSTALPDPASTSARTVNAEDINVPRPSHP